MAKAASLTDEPGSRCPLACGYGVAYRSHMVALARNAYPATIRFRATKQDARTLARLAKRAGRTTSSELRRLIMEEAARGEATSPKGDTNGSEEGK